LNKLAVLAFALLLFFSTMLWYLANGSLNEYLKSQVLLQSQYYSGQNAQLLKANFSADEGKATFEQLNLSNLNDLSHPQLLSFDKVTAQLARVASTQLNSPSIQNKNTTIVNIEKLTLHNVHAWSELTSSGKTNLEVLAKQVSKQLALDYPALYPNISAELYAKEHPELNATTAIAELEKQIGIPEAETNQAVIESKAAKQKKRILGKAQTRIMISSVIINELTLTSIKNNKELQQEFQNIEFGRIGDKNGIDSNQLGGELLRQILNHLIRIEKNNPR